MRPGALRGGMQPDDADPRVGAVLAVLRGRTVADSARSYDVDPVLLHRWVRGFVASGTASVTNRPLEDAAAQRDRFLAAFAHEMRTPLAVAAGWVDVLEEAEVEDPLVRSSVARLSEAISELTERTRDVELLVAASLGRLRVTRERVVLGALLPTLPADTVGDVEAHELEVDPTLFSRVLRDLWRAVTLPPQPRAVTVQVTQVGEWQEVRLVREADPIDSRVLQALFDPFDLNDDATGITIGLYLARALTVAHGGTLGVEQDDEKAVFWVRVPA